MTNEWTVTADTTSKAKGGDFEIIAPFGTFRISISDPETKNTQSVDELFKATDFEALMPAFHSSTGDFITDDRHTEGTRNFHILDFDSPEVEEALKGNGNPDDKIQDAKQKQAALKRDFGTDSARKAVVANVAGFLMAQEKLSDVAAKSLLKEIGCGEREAVALLEKSKRHNRSATLGSD